MKIFKTKYRVVADNYCGFECQKKSWWWPFWYPLGFTNTHSTLGLAKKHIEGSGKVIAIYVDD